MKLPRLMLQGEAFVAAAALVGKSEFENLFVSFTAVMAHTAAVNHVVQG